MTKRLASHMPSSIIRRTIVPTLPNGVKINAPITASYGEILTPAAIAFLADLQRTFGARRKELLAARVTRQARLDAGEKPDFLPETKHIRESSWRCAPI